MTEQMGFSAFMDFKKKDKPDKITILDRRGIYF